MARDRKHYSTGDALPIRVPRIEKIGSMSASYGEQSWFVTARREGGQVEIRIFGSDFKPTSTHVVDLTYTRMHFSGWRAWFVCPVCGRRMGVLWFYAWGGWDWRCRHCLNLNYYSQRLTPQWRAHHMIGKLQQRMGSKGKNVYDDFDYMKPKWMRWATFEKLMRRHEAYFEKMLALELESIRKLGASIGMEFAGLDELKAMIDE